MFVRHQPLSFSLLLAILVVAVVSIGCSASAPARIPAAATSAPLRQSQQQPTAAPAQPTSAPAPTSAPEATAAPSGNDSDGSVSEYIPNNPSPIDRKIIKNAQLSIVVQNAATALFQITGISSDVGGYVVGSRTFSVGDRTGAQISIAVPVDRFEEAVNMVRNTALRIEQDMTSSAEVTEQFVDLQSRLRNLEATAARLRDFLNKANTITETLKVNDELTRIESESEQIKGKLNALNARSAFSTIAIDINETYPTPAPTFTPTVTPTATPTVTPTPVIWRPDETFSSAATVQTSLFQGLVNVLIWFSVVFLPYLVGALLFGLLIRWFIQKTRPNTPARTTFPAPSEGERPK